MDNLKLCSIRIESESVKEADAIAKGFSLTSRSDIMRLAIWVGLKVVRPRNYSDLMHLWWSERYKGDNVMLEDVIHTAEPNFENKDSSK